MAKKGDLARQSVMKTIIDAFGSNFICVDNKKIYVQVPDGPNGEMLQFAITMTMPKVPVVAGAPTTAPTDWTEDSVSSGQNTQATPVELSPEDKAKVQALMEKLNIK